MSIQGFGGWAKSGSNGGCAVAPAAPKLRLQGFALICLAEEQR